MALEGAPWQGQIKNYPFAELMPIMTFSSRKLINFHSKLFSAYLSLAPVFWLPYLGSAPISLLKTLLLYIFLTMTALICVHEKKIQIPGGNKTFAVLFLYLIGMLPALVFSNISTGAYRLAVFFQIIVFLIGCGVVIRDGRIYQCLVHALYGFGFLLVLSSLSIIFIPITPSPLIDGLSISQTGFGGLRTGWSASISLYLPYFLMFATSGSLLLIVFLVSGVFNQFATGGRSGLVAFAVAVMISFILKFQLYRFFLFLVMSICFYYVIDHFGFFDVNRFFYAEGADLNDFSSGRISQYLYGFNAFLDRPMFGYGFGGALYDGPNVHNVFINAAVQGGLFYFVAVLLVFMYPIFVGLSKFRLNVVHAAALLSIVSGAVVAMFEPSSIVSGFNMYAMWWVGFAILASSVAEQS